jgi:hypothetical protein
MPSAWTVAGAQRALVTLRPRREIVRTPVVIVRCELRLYQTKLPSP